MRAGAGWVVFRAIGAIPSADDPVSIVAGALVRATHGSDATVLVRDDGGAALREPRSGLSFPLRDGRGERTLVCDVLDAPAPRTLAHETLAELGVPSLAGAARALAVPVVAASVPHALVLVANPDPATIEDLMPCASIAALVAGQEIDGRRTRAELAHAFEDARLRRGEEARLVQSEASFRALAAGLPDAILVHREGRIVYGNAAMAQLLGYDGPADLLGRPVLDIVHPDDLAAVRQRVGRLRDGAPVVPFVEERLVRKDGSVAFAEVGGIRIDFEGRPAIVAVGRDVTERKRMQAQLAQSDRLAAVGTLAAGVAHEINNPLTYVLLNLDSALCDLATVAGTTDPAVQRLTANLRDHLIAAREGATRVKSIVRDLRTFARVDETSRGPIDVRRAVESALDLVAHETRHRARVVRRLDAVPLVDADLGRISQVVLNLVLNAAQALPLGQAERHAIVVSTGMAGGLVTISVADDGPGIAPELLGRIFEPFVTTKAPGEGSGLGLAICRGIVEGYGGRIHVTSAVGGGTTFVVSLPATQRAAEPLAAAPSPPPPATSRVPRVLVVDDEPLMLQSLARSLGRRWSLVVAASGAEAKGLLGVDATFDVVVCDVMMPDLSGLDLHAWLREHVPDLASRVLFVTGADADDLARAHPEIGRERWLAKPFDADELERRVLRLAERSGRGRAP